MPDDFIVLHRESTRRGSCFAKSEYTAYMPRKPLNRQTKSLYQVDVGIVQSLSNVNSAEVSY